MRRAAAVLRLAVLELAARRRRILALLAFAAVFLAAAGTAATLGRRDGHVEMDSLFAVGGYPLISGIMLLGWLLGRFPVVAALVLMSGVISGDRVSGHARLLAVRPVAPSAIYLARFAVLAGLAFLLSGLLMPLFDLIMLGEWAGPATFVLIAAHVAVWGGLTFLLSTLTRLDAWLALMAAVLAMVWAALGDAGLLPVARPIADLVGFILPPQSQLFALEGAFGELQPIPWNAFWFCLGYGAVALVAGVVALGRREV